MKNSIKLLLLLFMMINVYGQNETGSTFLISANISKEVRTNLLNRYWDSDFGISGFAEMPFYQGNLQAGVLAFPFKTKTEEQPDFNSTFVYGGWGKEINLPLSLSLYGGIKMGVNMMSFDDDNLDAYVKNESELMGGFNFRLNYNIYANIFLSASTDLLVLFTERQVYFHYISAGISSRFNSPAWLKDFFN